MRIAKGIASLSLAALMIGAAGATSVAMTPSPTFNACSYKSQANTPTQNGSSVEATFKTCAAVSWKATIERDLEWAPDLTVWSMDGKNSNSGFKGSGHCLAHGTYFSSLRFSNGVAYRSQNRDLC